MKASNNSPPASWLIGLTLKSRSGPYLSPASWSALPWLASARFNVPTWVEMVLGPFAETKGPRLPRRNQALSGAKGKTHGEKKMLGKRNFQ